MIYFVNLQSVRTTDRAAFTRALRSLRRQQLRAVRVSQETNDYGHVRTYRIEGRWEAARLADAGFDNRLCTWQSAAPSS